MRAPFSVPAARLRSGVSAVALLSGAALAWSAPLGAQRPAGPAPTGTTADAAAPTHALVVRGTVDGADLVRAARRQLGVRYRLGGETPRAFDCSGFVRYVFAEYGIAVPRTAREQAGIGVAPYPGDLQPGDLLFFWGGEGAQHVAIYAGRDSIIHASSSGRRVRMDRLRGRGLHRNWFGQRLIAVRRVLPAEGVYRLPGVASADRRED